MEANLEMQLPQATLLSLKSILEPLSDMFNEAHFEFSGTGWQIQAVDTSCRALVALFLPKDLFKNYRCCDDGFSMGLKLASMVEVLRCANNDDVITITAEAGWSDPLTFRFESPKNGVVSTFFFDAVHIDGVPLPVQDPSEHENQAIIRLPSAQFMHICKKLSSFGDCEDRDTDVGISVKEEGVCFFARGENGTSRIECRQTPTAGEPKESTIVEMKEKVFPMFALKYIKPFSELSTLSDQVTISLSSKKPSAFEYKIAGMGYIRCYTVPMGEDEIQNEGDEVQNEGDEVQRIGMKKRCRTDD